MARKPRTPRAPRSLSPETVASSFTFSSVEDVKDNRDSVPTADLSTEGDVCGLDDEIIHYDEPANEIVRDMFAIVPDEPDIEEKDSLLARVTKRRKKKQGDSLDELSQIRQERRASRRRSWRLRVLRLILITCLLAGGIYGVFFSPLFSLSLAEVNISTPDDSPIAEEDIRTSLVDYAGLSIVRLSPASVAQHIEDTVAGTDNVDVTRVFPHGLSISYSLKEPYACLVSSGTCSPIDETGRRIPENASMNIDTVIHISYKGRAEDMGNAVEIARDILNTIDGVDENIRQSIARCEIDKDGNVQLLFNDERAVAWGQSSDNQKKAEILSVLLSEPATFYDISVPSAPVKR